MIAPRLTRLAATAWLAVTLGVALPASSVVIDLDDGSGNTTAPPSDPGWTHMGTRAGLSVIYLGGGWILTASHVPFGSVVIGGVVYEAVPGSRIVLETFPGVPADVAVWKLVDGPVLPFLEIGAATPNVGDEVLMIGFGRSRGATEFSCGPFSGFDTLTPNAMRWGTNEIEANGFDIVLSGFTTRSMRVDFDAHPPGSFDNRCAATVDCPEAQASVGDSGGAVFRFNGGGGNWELVGVLYAISSFSCNDPQHPETALFGDQTFMSELPFYRDQLMGVVRTECNDGIDNDGDLLVDLADPGCLSAEDDDEAPDCDGADDDGDSVGNVCDNCTLVFNPSQRDTNGDGYGNICDADYNNNGTVGGSDFNKFRLSFGTSIGDPEYDEDVDIDGDGVIGGDEFAFFRDSNGGVPGPSGLVP